MAGDELERFEAILGAVSRSLSDDGNDDPLADARCPKCEASSFVRVSDLYEDAVRRLSEGDVADVVREGGRTDSQIVARLAPPRRRSPRGIVAAVAVPLAGVSFYLYRRFGDTIGQASIVITLVVTVIVLLTTLRRLSDQYYARRHEWNTLFMCRRCGQLVRS
jgi:hypothetical protein